MQAVWITAIVCTSALIAIAMYLRGVKALPFRRESELRELLKTAVETIHAQDQKIRQLDAEFRADRDEVTLQVTKMTRMVEDSNLAFERQVELVKEERSRLVQLGVGRRS